MCCPYTNFNLGSTMTQPAQQTDATPTTENEPRSLHIALGHGKPTTFLYIKALPLFHGHVALELREGWQCQFGRPIDADEAIVRNTLRHAMAAVCQADGRLPTDHPAVQLLASCAALMAARVIARSEECGRERGSINHCLIASYEGPTVLHACGGSVTLATTTATNAIPPAAVEQTFNKIIMQESSGKSGGGRTNPDIPDDVDGLKQKARVYFLAPASGTAHVLSMQFTPDQLYPFYLNRDKCSIDGAMQYLERLADAGAIDMNAKPESMRIVSDSIARLLVKTAHFDSAPPLGEDERFIHYLILCGSSYYGSDNPGRIHVVAARDANPLPAERIMQIFHGMILDAAERHAVEPPNTAPAVEHHKILH